MIVVRQSFINRFPWFGQGLFKVAFVIASEAWQSRAGSRVRADEIIQPPRDCRVATLLAMTLKRPCWFGILVLIFLMVAWAGNVSAQNDDATGNLVDLYISSEYSLSERKRLVHVHNHSNVVARDVEILIESSHPNLITAYVDSGDRFLYDRSAGILPLPDISPGGHETFTVGNLSTLGALTTPGTHLVETRVTVAASSPPEINALQHNNSDVFWFVVYVDQSGTFASSNNHVGFHFGHDGETAAVSVSVDNRLPDRNTQVNFRIRVKNIGDTRRGLYPAVEDAHILISASPGLSVDHAYLTNNAPSGTAWVQETGIWDVGRLNPKTPTTERASKELVVPVVLTGDGPLERYCFTAALVRSRPPPHASLARHQFDNTSTVCLGNPKILLGEGVDTYLFASYPCIGSTDYPCNADDTVEIVALTRGNQGQFRLKNKRVDLDSSATSSNIGWSALQPENVVVHVDDRRGRATKGGSTIWSTGNLMDLRDSWQLLSSGGAVEQAVTVTSPGGGPAPGRWLLTNTDDGHGNFDLLNAVDNSKVAFPSTNLSDLGNNPSDYFVDAKVDFWALGTYEALLENKVTISGVEYTDSATYTFHVGPVSELEIRDAGPSPLLTRGQWAYTLLALNNGPNAAPAVRVRISGVPEDVAVIVSEGTYTNGDWVIGELESRDDRMYSGKSPGPTLTLWVNEDTGPVDAEIENTQIYSVVVDGTTHMAEYLDYDKANNHAMIEARRGTGVGHSNVPNRVRIVEAFVANILVWDPVAQVNGYDVTHYQVWRDDSPWVMVADNVGGTVWVDFDFELGTPAQYRVVAVNSFGVPGPWSGIVSSQGLTGASGLRLIRPTVPENLSARLLSDGESVELKWDAPSISPATGQTIQPIEEYRIQMSDGEGANWVDTGARVTSSRTSWIDRNFPPNVLRRYRVQAINSVGPGPWSDPVEIMHDAPSTGDPVKDSGPSTMPAISASREIGSDGQLILRVRWDGHTLDTEDPEWWTVVEYREQSGEWWYCDETQTSETICPHYQSSEGGIVLKPDAAYQVRACRLTFDQLDDVRITPEGKWCDGRSASTAWIRQP